MAVNKILTSWAGLAFLCLSFYGVLSASAEDRSTEDLPKKRDPFVALVNSNGKIKTGAELFRPVEKKPLSMNIVLKAILWDEQRPLAMINNKIYSEGKEIAPGLILEKIQPNSVVLNDNGNQVTVQLRKAVKNE